MTLVILQGPSRRPRVATALVAWLLGASSLAGGCDRGEPSGPNPLAQTHERAAPDRVVSLSPVASRFLLALGARSALVGIDAESARLDDLAGIAVIDWSTAKDLNPDVVIVPDPPPWPAEGEPMTIPSGLLGSETQVVVFAPHDLEDVYELSRTLGARLVGPARALAFESSIGRPIGIVGGASPDRERPRVIGVVSLDPLGLAGGHSFETDLIEIAGGSSATHGGEDVVIHATPARLAQLDPDLVIVFTRAALEPPARAAARAALPVETLVDFFAFERDTFWLDDPAGVARRLQALIAVRRAERDEEAIPRSPARSGLP